jgi:16S rRNA (uracil1498-N3)-methyltransferase
MLMPLTRIYQPSPLHFQTLLILDDQASHHLARVLRASVGDALILFNGQGGEFAAEITAIDKKKVEVKVMEFSPREVESPLHIQLAQGIARGEKMDFIVQKAVELGVSSIVPLITERCNVRLDQERQEKRLQHWQSVVISACEQSGRNRLPELSSPYSLEQWLGTVDADYRFVLSPHTDKKLSKAPMLPNSKVVLLIGPEGGLSDQEVSLAIENGFTPLNLGPRVLRTETATLAAVSALQTQYGDFS